MLKLWEKQGEKSGAQVLIDAMCNDKTHLARFILDALDGKVVNARTERAQTPLIRSVLLPDSHRRSTFMTLLLQRGADVNCQDEAGRTALSFACERGHLEAVKMLVQHNADPELLDCWGNGALLYATAAGHGQVVEFLVRAFKRLGLQIDRPNKAGNCARQIAEFLGHKDCIQALGRRPLDSEAVSGHYWGDSQESSRRTFSDTSLEKAPPWANDVHRYARNVLESMDSIEEEGDTGEQHSSNPPGLVRSDIQTPVQRVRSWSVQYGTHKKKLMDKVTNGHCSLPPLKSLMDLDSATSTFGSPKELRLLTEKAVVNPMKPHLNVLLTHIAASNAVAEKFDHVKEERRPVLSGFTKFDENFYQKRRSLPAGAFSPVPPERPSLRKNQTRSKSAQVAAPPPLTEGNAALANLGNKLFRRFTFPEFRKSAKDFQVDNSGTATFKDPEAAVRSMSRSETYPVSSNHPQVGSKPSIDSISAVKCEFDCPARNASA